MGSLAIIPARGGSKRIPRKNIRDFLGKPIISYSIEAALKSELFEEVMVSTDDDEIADIAVKYGAKVPFFRSYENSNDFAGLTDVLIEVLLKYLDANKNFNLTCCILPTAPFVTSENIKQAYNMIESKKYDCIFPVTEYSYPIQRSLKFENNFVKMNWPENFSKRSQDLEHTYHDAGQFYFFMNEALLKEKKLFTNHSGCLVLSNLEVQDIDSETDWLLAEIKYKMMKNNNLGLKYEEL
jgi:N-acylneuraminate cytidylyltransferase